MPFSEIIGRRHRIFCLPEMQRQRAGQQLPHLVSSTVATIFPEDNFDGRPNDFESSLLSSYAKSNFTEIAKHIIITIGRMKFYNLW